MQYEGKARHPVPSNRYPIFIDAFEKYVAQQQAMIRAAEGMQRPYLIMVQALESMLFNNASSIVLQSGLVTGAIQLLSTDRLSTFFPIVTAIGKALASADLHRTGEPARAWSQWSAAYRMIWHCSEGRTVSLWLDMPDTGGVGCPVRRQTVSNPEVVWIHEPEPGETYDVA